jgi:hypothetical protein
MSANYYEIFPHMKRMVMRSFRCDCREATQIPSILSRSSRDSTQTTFPILLLPPPLQELSICTSRNPCRTSCDRVLLDIQVKALLYSPPKKEFLSVQIIKRVNLHMRIMVMKTFRSDCRAARNRRKDFITILAMLSWGSLSYHSLLLN